MAAPPSPLDLARLVGERVRERRLELGWSQRDLHGALTTQGARWSKASVGLLETEGVRGERLSDLATLCRVLNVSLMDLLAGDHAVRLRDGNVKDLAWVRDSVAGGHPDPYVASDVPVPDDQDEKNLVAYLATGVESSRDVEGLLKSSMDRWAIEFPEAGNRWTGLRDLLAQIDEETPKNSARARRGHAARRLRAAVAADTATSLPEGSAKVWRDLHRWLDQAITYESRTDGND